MNIVIDIGNTSNKVAVFEDDLLIIHQAFPKSAMDMMGKFLMDYSAGEGIISSVGQDAKQVLTILKVKGIELTHLTPLPIKNSYETPQTLGKDRLANAVAANFLYPNQNTLIIDMGTCVKYDFVDNKGEYHGGAISPGFGMRYNALHQFTERLPFLDKTEPQAIIGKNTEASMSSGVYNGVLFEIEGFIRHYKQDYGALNVILTGGEAVFFEKALKNSIFAHPFLTLIGLNVILEHNKKLP